MTAPPADSLGEGASRNRPLADNTVSAYDGGLRRPHLERIDGTPDRLVKLFAPR